MSHSGHALHANAPARSTGFTVVELVVVIAIVVVLIGLLLPTLARAREAARTVACASNIRQIGIATVAYAGRHHGYLPVPVLGSNATSGNILGLPESAIWATATPGILDFSQGTLIPDLGGARVAEELFKCPSDEEPRQLSERYTVHLRNFSYVFNGEIVESYDSRRGFTSKRITRIRQPAQKILVYENGDNPGISGTPVVYGSSNNGQMAHLLIALRHRSGSNAFYADWHVELFDSLILKDNTINSIRDNAAWVKYFVFESQ